MERVFIAHHPKSLHVCEMRVFCQSILFTHKSNMGGCCGRFDDDLCVVCRYSCSSSACKCSRMHAECAHEYCARFGSACIVCGTKLRTRRLQMRPLLNDTDTKTLVKYKEKRNEKIKRQTFELRQFGNHLFPIIIGFFRRHGVETSDCVHAMQTVVVDSNNRNQMKQYMFGKGFKEQQIAKSLQTMQEIVDLHDCFSPRVQNSLNSNFQRWQYTFTQSSTDSD